MAPRTRHAGVAPQGQLLCVEILTQQAKSRERDPTTQVVTDENRGRDADPHEISDRRRRWRRAFVVANCRGTPVPAQAQRHEPGSRISPVHLTS